MPTALHALENRSIISTAHSCNRVLGIGGTFLWSFLIGKGDFGHREYEKVYDGITGWPPSGPEEGHGNK
jgi:hypothetical protein